MMELNMPNRYAVKLLASSQEALVNVRKHSGARQVLVDSAPLMPDGIWSLKTTGAVSPSPGVFLSGT